MENKGFQISEHEFKAKYRENKDMISTLEGWISFVGNVRGKNDEKYLKFKQDFIDLSFVYIKFKDNLNYHLPIKFSCIKKKLNYKNIGFNYIVENGVKSSVLLEHINNTHKFRLVLSVELITELKENSDILLNLKSEFKMIQSIEYLVIYINKYLNF